MQACLAEIRRAGSYSRSASRRSRPFSSKFATRFLVSSLCHLGKEDLKSGNDVTPGHVVSSGVPSILEWDQYCRLPKWRAGASYLKILKISSISESPGKSGFRVHISAKIAPIDHMSTPVEYCRPPSRISGDRYHSVTTYSSSR